jgi:hypothetical protein
MENLLSPERCPTIARTGPGIQDRIERNGINFDVRIAAFVELVHPFEDLLRSLSSRTASTALRPGIEDRVEVDGRRLYIVVSSSAVTVHHVLQNSFRSGGGSRLA